MPDQNTNIKPVTWIYISAAVFIVFILLAVFLGFFGDALNHLKTSTYFFLLIPLALMAAAFLFGAMKSHAKYSGKAYGGTLELGGPVVLLFLVIYAGYKFRPVDKDGPFNITLNVFGKASSPVIIQSGILNVFYGAAKTRIKITDGQAVVQEIPPEYRGKELRILPEADGYAAKDIHVPIPAGANNIDLYLERIPDAVSVSGIVINKKGKAVKNAVLVFANGLIKDTTDELGNFHTTLPFKDGTPTTLRVYNANLLAYDNMITLSQQASLTIQLR